MNTETEAFEGLYNNVLSFLALFDQEDNSMPIIIWRVGQKTLRSTEPQ